MSPLSLSCFLFDCSQETIIRNGFIINETPDDTIYNDNFQRVIFFREIYLTLLCVEMSFLYLARRIFFPLI